MLLFVVIGAATDPLPEPLRAPGGTVPAAWAARAWPAHPTPWRSVKGLEVSLLLGAIRYSLALRAVDFVQQDVATIAGLHYGMGGSGIAGDHNAAVGGVEAVAEGIPRAYDGEGVTVTLGSR